MLIEILFHNFVLLLELGFDVASHFFVNFSNDLVNCLWVENLVDLLVVDTDWSHLLELFNNLFCLNFFKFYLFLLLNLHAFFSFLQKDKHLFLSIFNFWIIVSIEPSKVKNNAENYKVEKVN